MICEVNGCRNYITWWMCMNCKGFTCRGHQAFTGRTVPFCALCYKDWLKKRNIKNFKQFEKYVNKNLVWIGNPLYSVIKDVLEEE